MVAETYAIDIPTPITRYGYFIYAWKAMTVQGDLFLYVGRTGDDVYTSANPPVVRVGQHLGRGRAAALTNNLCKRGVNARECAELRVFIHGPIFPPALGDRDAHDARVTAMEALERALSDALKYNDYTVVGSHPRNWNLCLSCWQGLQEAFGQHFDLGKAPPGRDTRPDHPCYLHA